MKVDRVVHLDQLSAFYKDDHGGIDMLNGTYNCLGLTPKGRDEDGLELPAGLGAISRSL